MVKKEEVFEKIYYWKYEVKYPIPDLNIAGIWKIKQLEENHWSNALSK